MLDNSSGYVNAQKSKFVVILSFYSFKNVLDSLYV